ncbi:MAG: hypothetical protein M3P00_02350 [Gemmatimonadota bacterium]|nr:hypothetical protein [Gemmatimonadota bacterium]
MTRQKEAQLAPPRVAWSLRRHVPEALYAVTLILSAAVVFATLAVAQPIIEGKEEAHYGIPFWFAATDMSTHVPLPPQKTDLRWAFNPWENPVHFRAGGFVLSYLVVALPLISIIWLVRRRRAATTQLLGRSASNEATPNRE